MKRFGFTAVRSLTNLSTNTHIQRRPCTRTTQFEKSCSTPQTHTHTHIHPLTPSRTLTRLDLFVMAGKTLADWLDTSSDEDSHPRPIYRKSSNAHAVFEALSKSHNLSGSRTRSPNAPSFSSDSPVVGAGGGHHRRRSASRNSLRRSSSKASLVVGPIKGVGVGSPTDPPLPQIDPVKNKKHQEAEERKRKMEEMKARLRETLGEAAVEKIAGKGDAAKVVVGSGIPALSQSDDDFPSVGVAGSNVNPLPSHLPPLSARSSVDFNHNINRRASPNHIHYGHGHHTSATPPPLSGYGPFTSTPPRHVVVETEVMLADRGTQTACEVEVQTDPDPTVASCPQCYAETYGHTHHNFFTCGHIGSPAVMGAAMTSVGAGGGDPIFSKMLANRLGSLGGQPLYAAAASAHAHNYHSHSPHDPPYPNPHHRFQTPPPQYSSLTPPSSSPCVFPSSGPTTCADQWNEQLRFIEGSIDMLIRRYNLPPPPGMEQYQPAGMHR